MIPVMFIERHPVCLSCSAESATEAISLALHSAPREFHLTLITQFLYPEHYND